MIPRDRPIALVDFPDTSNVGDSAIWLGELAWLRRNRLGRPIYTASTLSFAPREMRRRITPETTILLSGGGNFGDLYPTHQRLRETIIRTFTGHRIVQMPQSIHFETDEAIDRARRVVDAHPDLTILVRDHSSLDFVRSAFHVAHRLCPDMALCLGPLVRPFPPTTDVVWLAREDRETDRSGLGAIPKGVRAVDWLQDSETPVFRFNRLLRHAVRHWPTYRNWWQRPLSWTYTALAEERLDRGLRLLGAGRVVITDRLHGHILSLLLGIPHVLLDNSYGKIRGFHEAWTHGSPLVRWSETVGEAFEMATRPWPTGATR